MIAIGPGGILLNSDRVTGVSCASRMATKEMSMLIKVEIMKNDCMSRKCMYSKRQRYRLTAYLMLPNARSTGTQALYKSSSVKSKSLELVQTRW